MVHVGYRRPKNEAEGQLYDELTNRGWTVSKRGWPDFMCYKDDQVICVEVKRKEYHNLRKDQFRVMRVLASYGIPCFIWSPDSRRLRRVKPARREVMSGEKEVRECGGVAKEDRLLLRRL